MGTTVLAGLTAAICPLVEAAFFLGRSSSVAVFDFFSDGTCSPDAGATERFFL
jgi:hypothetical protein